MNMNRKLLQTKFNSIDRTINKPNHVKLFSSSSTKKAA